MKYNVQTDEIQGGVLYKVAGEQSVIYNEITYNTGDNFRGIVGITDFEYVGFGTQEVNEVLEFFGGSLEFVQNPADAIPYTSETELNGMSIEFELNEAEKIVQEITEIMGMSLELVDYPFFSFFITEDRFSMKPED